MLYIKGRTGVHRFLHLKGFTDFHVFSTKRGSRTYFLYLEVLAFVFILTIAYRCFNTYKNLSVLEFYLGLITAIPSFSLSLFSFSFVGLLVCF